MSTNKKIHAINPDFYCTNAYAQRQKRGIHHVLIKVLFMVCLVGIALWGYRYMSTQGYFTSESFTVKTPLVKKEIPIKEIKNEMKVAKVTKNNELTPEQIAKIVENVLIELNSEKRKPIENQKKNVETRLKRDELSQEYVNSVRNRLGN